MHFGGVLLQFLHASNKKQSRFIPCGKWIHANNLKTSKNQSTNPQTLNPLQKKCVQLRPAARTAVRDWNVICSRKHVFIVCLWACRCLCFEEAGPTQEHSNALRQHRGELITSRDFCVTPRQVSTSQCNVRANHIYWCKFCRLDKL